MIHLIVAKGLSKIRILYSYKITVKTKFIFPKNYINQSNLPEANLIKNTFEKFLRY